jgi:hypothetical protein
MAADALPLIKRARKVSSMEGITVWRERWDVRLSARAYLSTLLVGGVLGLWAGYLWPAQPVLKGQSAAVLVPLLAFVVALGVWLRTRGRSRLRGWPLAFMTLLAVAWLANLISYRIHGDAFTYGALLFIPVVLMVVYKPPSLAEGASALISLAWAITIVLVATRALEMPGLLAVKDQPAGIISFDEEYYWLPINDLLGIDGRWPGPFGHNGYTAMMGAFIIVIAIAFWSRSSWVFLFVGAFTLLVTSGRASAGAAAAGILLFAMFTSRGWLGRQSRALRLVVGSLALVAGIALLFSGKSGLTGRQNIWPAFWDLWLTSPITGVGTSGIAVSGGLTQEFGHAHSMYLDLLARNGLIAFALVMAALLLGLGITLAAALRGQPGPLALLAAYLVTAVTEPRNDWLHPGIYVLMITICVLAASEVVARRPPPNNRDESELAALGPQ